MTLKVYNTLTRQKEEFIPAKPGKVSIYVCGVTPYNHPHIGNARPFVTWDVIKRYLRYRGFEVLHVQNFTDVDDKIINTANAEGVTWNVIADRYIKAYFDVMDQLAVEHADVYPRVSGHMPEIIEMIQTLVDRGYAYSIGGDVYYSVEKFTDYGKLSSRTLDDMKAGARVDVNDQKRHPMDFALWKAAKPGEPAWDSPWGPGRPGWHIECSAMSQKYLGCGFDFHGGGSDLIFPHHENEIAQSEAACGCSPVVHYWLHNGFITVNEEKMSKSLGNFFLVRDILAHFSAEVLRFFILSTHYRSPLDFSDERLNEAARGLERLKGARDNLSWLLSQASADAGGEAAQKLREEAKQARIAFEEAMDDDFNTSLAISVLFGLTKTINIYQTEVAKGTIGIDKEAVNAALQAYEQIASVLGILQEIPGKASNADSELVAELMNIMLSIRQSARERKDWGTADSIRDRLAEIGIVIEDSPQGARWKRREV